MRKIINGFTMIELLVVISVIGILTTISVISFNRYQADSRDTQRSTRVTLLAEALEKYYDENGEYPSCNAMTDTATAVTTNTLVGVDKTVLVAPRADSSQTNSIDFCTDITSAIPTTDSFAYVGDGSTTCTSTGCLEFTLQYVEEGTGVVKSIESRRKAAITTSGAITDLAAAVQGFSQINLTWTAVPNATSYAVQRATSAGGPYTSITPSPFAFPTTNALSVTGLTAGTQYYFQVAPIGSTGQGGWSNTANATTSSLATPTCTATPNSVSQITLTWNSIALASTYTVEYANNAAFTGASIVTGITTPQQYVLTGLTAGDTRYFRVKAIAPGDVSDYCATVQATTTVPAPATLTATTNSSTQITASWATVSVATSYTLQYATNSGFTSPTTITGIATTSRAVTGLAQGQIYYFRVYALVGAVSSSASPTANATTTINTPSAPSVQNNMGGVRPYADGYWIRWDPTDSPSGNWYYAQTVVSGTCPAGTSIQYYVMTNYDSPSTQYDTGWQTANTWYIVRPYSSSSGYGPYYVRFGAFLRCQGPSGGYSANSGTTWTGYNGPG